MLLCLIVDNPSHHHKKNCNIGIIIHEMGPFWVFHFKIMNLRQIFNIKAVCSSSFFSLTNIVVVVVIIIN